MLLLLCIWTSAVMSQTFTVTDADGGASVVVSWPSAETVYISTLLTFGSPGISSDSDSAERFGQSSDINRYRDFPQFFNKSLVTFYDVKKAALSALGKDPQLAAYTDLIVYFEGYEGYEGRYDYDSDTPTTTEEFRRRMADGGVTFDDGYDSNEATMDMFGADLVNYPDMVVEKIIVDANTRRTSTWTQVPAAANPTVTDFEVTCETDRESAIVIGPFTVTADLTGYVLEFRTRLNDQLNEDYAEEIRAHYCSDADDSDCIESIDAVSYSPGLNLGNSPSMDSDYYKMDNYFASPYTLVHYSGTDILGYTGTEKLEGDLIPVQCLIAVKFKVPEMTLPPLGVMEDPLSNWASYFEDGPPSFAHAPPMNGAPAATDPEGTAHWAMNAFSVYAIAALLTVLVTVNVTCLVMRSRCSEKQYDFADDESE